MNLSIKRLIILSTCTIFFLFPYNTANAQIWKKVKKEVKKRSERNVVDKAGDATDKTINGIFDGDNDKKNNDSQDKDKINKDKQKRDSANNHVVSTGHSFKMYENYDFTPGDNIIFAPDLSQTPDAELPARFMVIRGNAEINSYEGEKVLHMQGRGDAVVAPLLNSNEYLPEQFTLEFDLLFESNEEELSSYKFNDFNVHFREKDQEYTEKNPLYHFHIYTNSTSSFATEDQNEQGFTEGMKASMGKPNVWHHIALYVNKNVGKAYIDGKRVNATNMLPLGADKLDITIDFFGVKIKNLRLAEGGKDKYQQIITDGKFVSHGILFNVGQATIRPESMGAINEIVDLMKEHADLKFEIAGHTDSDGEAEANLKLSKERAKAVKSLLEEMGIDTGRLTTNGYGETKPIDSNDTDEGKANNRRVEFKKI